MDVGHVLDAGGLHRTTDALRDLLDHGGTPDVLGQQDVRHREPDRETLLARRGCDTAVVGDAREHRRVRGDDAVAPSRPRHRDEGDVLGAARPSALEDPTEGLVGEDAGEVVDAPVPLRLPDHGDDLVGGEHAGVDELLEPGRVGDAEDLDLADLDGHRISDLRGRRPARASSGDPTVWTAATVCGPFTTKRALV